MCESSFPRLLAWHLLELIYLFIAVNDGAFANLVLISYVNYSLFQLMNVQVPFLFKYAIDYLNNLDSAGLVQTAGGTVFTALTAILLGCKCY